MTRISCEEYQRQLDEWLSGSCPDFEREEMRRHEAECPACRKAKEDFEVIIGTARSEGLRLPGDAYFADLQMRIEEQLEERGLAYTPNRWRRPVHRRAPVLSGFQGMALMAASIAILLWMQSVAALFAGSSRDAGPSRISAGRAAPGYQVAIHKPPAYPTTLGVTAPPAMLYAVNIEEAIKWKQAKIDEVMMLTDET